MWFQSQWAQKQQQTCRPPRRAAAGASEAEKKKQKKKTYILQRVSSPLWMSNQLHDSEGGPLFRIKHCNLIMCGLIKGPRVHPQPCTASSTWLDSEIPQGGGGRRRRRSWAPSFSPHGSIVSRRDSLCIWFQPAGASRKPWQPSDWLPPPGVCRTKAVSGIQLQRFAFKRDTFHLPF